MNIRCYFPRCLRHVAPFNEGNGHRHNLQIRVPVDDFHTQVFRVNFVPSETERSPADAPVPFRFTPLKTGPREYKMNMVSAQDSMAWETQGLLANRAREHLGVGDEGSHRAQKTSPRANRARPARARTSWDYPRPRKKSTD